MHIRSSYFFPIRLFAIMILVGLIVGKVKSQTNLVPNPSFEYYTQCPDNGGQIRRAYPWYSSDTTYTAAYSNACSTSSLTSVPNSNGGGGGFQYPKTGNGFAVNYFSYRWHFAGTSMRNYLQVKLNSKLIKNRCYYVSFYVNLANSSTMAVRNISLNISDTALKYIFPFNRIPPAKPQITQYGNPIITDTLNWVQVAGIYTAHGGEQHLSIGNFVEDSYSDHIYFDSTRSGPAAYNVDDVSVIPLDSMQLKASAGKDTTILKGDSVWIGSRICGLTNVVWYDGANNVIDTGAPGLWVKPTSNTFYVIEQDVCGQYSRDTVYITVAPLPVTLLSFNVIASAAKQSESINWETVSEINTSHFSIQRSTDGITFYTIGKVKAKGPNAYTFNDPLTTHDSRFTTLYYRLEIVDKNGSKTYSEIRSLFLTNGDSGFTITPNPAKDFITITGANSKEISISDASGRTVLTTCNAKIDISTLPKGVYFVAITTNNNRELRKFIKW